MLSVSIRAALLTLVVSFHTFFHQIDNYKEGYFLWVTAGGIEAAEQRIGPMESIPKELEEELGDDGEENPDEGEG